MSSGQGGGCLDQSFFRIATECAGVLKDFCRGQRAKAKKALQRLAQEHPNSFLPHRYLARLLYHESARVEADQQGASGPLPSHRRLSLLHSALLEAKQASELAPGSLSSAALRATLLVNLLVEESALQGGLAIAQEQPLQPSEAQACAGGLACEQGAVIDAGEVAWYQLQPEARCEAIKREFREAIAHCVRTLECSVPLLVEPVITISDAHARTCDPCCLRVQDSIVEWVKQDNWQRIVAEKRSVLACMHQVLESCHTLLDSTHIPVDGIVRLLQHILRPHQQDLQLWASQLLLSKGSVDDLQHKFETQAAVTELLRMLRPGRPVEDLSAGSALPSVVPIMQGKPQSPPPISQSHSPAGVAAPMQQQQLPQVQHPQAQQPQQQLRPVNAMGQMPAATVDTAACPSSTGAQAQPALAPSMPQQEIAPCLSAEQEWDEVREGVGATSSGTGASNGVGGGSRRTGGKAKNKVKGNDATRGPRKERSRYERYMDVETFWRTTSPEQRRALLKVPMAALLRGVRREQGNEAVDELIEGLVLLREQGNRAACYWLCPVCEQKFHSSRDFLGHVELVHEGLAVQDNKYVCCYKCQQDVVGMYYTSTRTPGYNLCFRCYAADAASVSSPEAFEKVFMRPSAGGRAWSHSDFMSTRDSFSSLSECSHRQPHHQHPQMTAAQKAQQRSGGPGAPAGPGGHGHVHTAACMHHPQCPHHAQGHAHSQAYGGLENSATHTVLTFGEASDEWLAPLPAGTLSAPVAVHESRPAPPSVGPGPATLPPSQTRSRGPRSKRRSGSSGSMDSMLGQSLHSRSLSEPLNHNQGRQGGLQPASAAGNSGANMDEVSDTIHGNSATWRSWWPTRLMQGWSGKGQPQQQSQSGSSQQHPSGPGSSSQGPGSSGQPGSHASSSQGEPPPLSHVSFGGYDGSGLTSGDDDVSLPQPPAARSALSRSVAAPDSLDCTMGAEGFAPGGTNGMVAELMTRLREIYLTDRDLGDMSLGSITQFVYRKLGAGAAADDLHLSSCPPGPRAVLLEFLAQPSIVFQRPQALAVVLGLLPLADLQMVAAYAVRQHEEAVSGAEAATRDIAAGSDDDGGVDDGEDDGDDTGGMSGSEGQEYHLERAAARVARVAAAMDLADASSASHMPEAPPRARRRLRYTSRRAPAGAAPGSLSQSSAVSAPQQVNSGVVGTALHQTQHVQLVNKVTVPGAQSFPPHAGGSLHIGNSHALNIHQVEEVDDGSAEEVSEEEMESAADGFDYAVSADGEALSLRGLPPHFSAVAGGAAVPRSQQQQLLQLRHAGGAGMHAVVHVGGAVLHDGQGADILCERNRSLGGSIDGDGEEGASEDVEGEGDEDGSEEEDGVSLGPEEEEEEEDGPCVSLLVVAGDVELGFDRLITQMWGGGADSDDAAAGQLEQQQVPVPAANGGSGATGGTNRSRNQQPGNRGRNQQVRQPSPTSRGIVAGNGPVPTGGSGGGVSAPDDAPLSEELVGPREDEPYLLVADWWLHHLRMDGGGQAPDELRVLRWVYGNIINVQAEEFCARQRELRGGRERDVAILELYDEVAAVWRSLQAVTDKRSRLEALRRATRGHFAVVKRLEESGGHASLEQATEFLDAVLSGYCQGQQGAALPGGSATASASGSGASAATPNDAAAQGEQPGLTKPSEAVSSGPEAAAAVVAVSGPGGDASASPVAPGGGGAAGTNPSGPLLYLCERAVEVVRRHPALAQEPSQRYASALLERELSVLALVEVMMAAEAEEAARERGVAEESLKRHRAEHRDAEAEYQRVQAEGPASHRKKDLLDKATKEAEHREQLRELAARLSSLSDNIAADEASKAKWADKQEEAERELGYVRDAIRQTSARRASLLDVCATLEVPLAPSAQQPHPHPHRQSSFKQTHRQPRNSSAAHPADSTASAEGAVRPADAGDECTAALALGSSAGSAAVATDMEWRATRLECLMYRVLWVSEAVKMFQPQYSPRPSTHHYDLFIRASHWAKQLSEEYEESIRAYCCELERLRARLRDVAAVDLGYEIGAAALEVIRRRIEAAARAAREAASLTLLKELEEEEERRKAALAAAKDSKDAGGGGASAGSKKQGANKKAAKVSQDSRSRAQKEKERELARQAEEEARRRAEEEDKERVAAARRAREAALEAELERRRRELEELEAQREAEAIRAAQEASLREQQMREQREREQREREHQLLREQREKEQREREQREREQREKAAASAAVLQVQQQQEGAASAAAAGRAGGAQAGPFVRKQETASQQHPQRRFGAGGHSEISPDKHPPKRNSAPNSRIRGSQVVLERSPSSPDSPADPRATLANGGVPTRGPVVAKMNGPVAIAASPVSPGQQGSVQPPSSVAPVAVRGKQGPPSMSSMSASAPVAPNAPPPADSAAAAAVAAATAGIGKAPQGSGTAPGARASPGKLGPQAAASSPAAGVNASRRAQHPLHFNAAAAAGMQAGASGAPTPGSGPTQAPAWAAAAPVAGGMHGQLQAPLLPPPHAMMPPPQQPVPQLPVQPIDAPQGPQGVGSSAMLATPVSPGAEFPPLSAANPIGGTQHHQLSRPLAPQLSMPQPQLQQIPPSQPSLGPQQASFPGPQPPHAQGLPDAQARFLIAAAAHHQQPQNMPLMLPPGEVPMLPSEHLHAQLRHQHLHQAAAQHQMRHQMQLQQQHQQLYQSSARPAPSGSAPVFDPFAENPLLKALSAMDAKAHQPTSPSGATGPATGAPALAPTAGSTMVSGSASMMTHVSQPNAPLQHPQAAQTHVPALMASMHSAAHSASAVSGAPEADTHIMSIMSILDQDGQSPGSGSRPATAPSQSATGGAKSSPAAASGSTAQSGPGSQSTTANSSPQRMVLPAAPPPGPPASMYGNPYAVAGGPPLLPPGLDTSPGAAAGVTAGSPAVGRPQQNQAGLMQNGPAGGLSGGVGLVHPQPDSLSGGVPSGANSGSGLPGLASSAAFGSGIWRQGGEQLPAGPQLPMSMLGLGLGLGSIGTGANTWGSVGLPQSSSTGGLGAAGGVRSGPGTSASPRQGSSAGGTVNWGASTGSGGAAASSGSTAAAASRENSASLPDTVDSLVASLPTTLLPSSLDVDTPSPSPAAGGPAGAPASALAPTAAPFYPASLRNKAAAGSIGSGSMSAQQHMSSTGVSGVGMGMNPMGMGPMANDGTAAWLSGLVPAKQGAVAGAMAGAAAAAAAMAAAANGLVAPGQVNAQQGLGVPGGLGGLAGGIGPGGMRYGMGLYSGDSVNWSHGLMQGPGGMVGAPGMPAPVRATSSTWAPFVPPALGPGGVGPSQQQYVQQATQQQQQQQQQAAQQPQMAGWPRGQRWRN